METMTAQDPRVAARRRRIGRIHKFAFKAFLIFFPAHAYVGWRLLADLPMDLAGLVLGWLALAVSSALIPYGTLASFFVADRNVADRLVWVGAVMMGWFSSLLAFTVVRDVALLFPAAGSWTTESAALVFAASVGATLIGFANARRVAKVVRVDVALDSLPAAFDGFAIAQISDIHAGPTIKAGYVRGIVERVNALEPDMIAITGDVVDGRVDQLFEETAPLADLRARHGAFVVTGNHEYYSGADEWMRAFGDMGLGPLENEHAVIEKDGAKLVVAGVNDFSAARFDPARASDPAAAVAGSPADAPKILLAHQPRSAWAAEAAGIDLQLSGHTHGGQFWPWNHFVRLQQPFTAGLARLGRLWVYTSRGTGYWGPPKRFGAPSEITLITLHSGVEKKIATRKPIKADSSTTESPLR